MSTEYIRYPNFSSGSSGPITIGQPVVGGIANNLLIVDVLGNLSQINSVSPYLLGTPTELLYYNSTTGAVTSDSGATRLADQTTNFKKVNSGAGSTVEFILGDPGLGSDAAVMHFTTTAGAAGNATIALLDASTFGAPLGYGGFVLDSTDGGFLAGQVFGLGNGAGFTANNGSTGENGYVFARPGSVEMSYTDGIIQDMQFKTTVLGPSWGQKGGNLWILPTQTVPTAGQVLGSILGGTGQVDWITPGGGGGFTGTPTQGVYLDASGNPTGDANFARIQADGQSALRSSGIETGYGTGVWFGAAYGFANGLSIGHFDNVNGIGSRTLYKKDLVTHYLSDHSGSPGVVLDGGVIMDFRNPVKYVSLGINDAGTANKESLLFLSTDLAYLRHTYAYNTGSSNGVRVDADSVRIVSDIPGVFYNAGLFNFSTQQYYIGDPANSINGISMGVNVSTRIAGGGDLSGVGNGISFFADDLNRIAGIGDVAGIKNSTSFNIADSDATRTATSVGKHPFLPSLTFHGTGVNNATVSGNYNGPASTTYTITVQYVNCQTITYTSLTGSFTLGDTVQGNASNNTGVVVAIGSGQVTLSNCTGSLLGDTRIDDLTNPGNFANGFMTYTSVRDLYDWNDGGAAHPFTPMNIAPTLLSHGVSVAFGSVVGHTITDFWDTTATNKAGLGLYLDYLGAAFAMGDVSNFWQGTKIFVNDVENLIEGRTDNSPAVKMFHVSKNPVDIVSFGYGALNSRTTGQSNSAYGYLALNSLTTGNNNLAIGPSSLHALTVTSGNIAIGKLALSSLNGLGGQAEENLAIGVNAGDNLTTGSHNVLIGNLAGHNVTTKDNNTIIGYNADVVNNLVQNSIALGNGATVIDNNQMVIGSLTSPISSVFFGSGYYNSGSGVDVALQNSYGIGANVAGKNFSIIAGIGTGTGIGGDILFRTSPAGSFGSSLNTIETWGKISPRRLILGDVNNVGNKTKIDLIDSSFGGGAIVNYCTSSFQVTDYNNPTNTTLLLDNFSHKFTLGEKGWGSGRYIEIWSNAGTITLGGGGIVVTDGGKADQAVNHLAYGGSYAIAVEAYDFEIGLTGTGSTTIILPNAGLANGLLGTTYVISDYGGTCISGLNTITIDAGTGNEIRSPTSPTGAQTYTFTANGERRYVKCVLITGGGTVFHWTIQ